MSLSEMRKNLKGMGNKGATGNQVLTASQRKREEIRKAKAELGPKWETDKATNVKTKQAKEKVDRKSIRETARAERKEERKTYRTEKKAEIKKAKDTINKGKKWETDPNTNVKTKKSKTKIDRKAAKKKAAESAAKKIAEKRKGNNYKASAPPM
tara:strand:- start:59 stop:520 length:462 start_codon:yes stop_codon:yes gene_type:complete